MSQLEQIIRPFQTEDVTPIPYHQPGQSGQAPVRLSVGLKGGSKIFSYSLSGTTTSRLGAKHKENPPKSGVLQDAMSQASN